MWEFLQGKLTCHGSSIGDNGENAKRVQGEVVLYSVHIRCWARKMISYLILQACIGIGRCKILPTKN